MKNVSWEELELRRVILIAKTTPAERRTYDIMITLKVPFYFQEIIFPYICDFVGMDRNFVIELDGGVHDRRDVYDDKRSRWLWTHGFETYRLSNDEVTEENIKRIVYQAPFISALAMREKIIATNRDYKLPVAV